MQVFIKIAITLALIFGAMWAVLPGLFGLMNFKSAHGQVLALVATGVWWLLLLSHPIALYVLWFVDSRSYWWQTVPLLMHILFFAIFGRDVSAR